MLKARENPDFAREPVRTEGRGQLGAQHFHRHLSIVLQVLGEINRRHPACTQLALDGITVGERGTESVYLVRHAPILSN